MSASSRATLIGRSPDTYDLSTGQSAIRFARVGATRRAPNPRPARRCDDQPSLVGEDDRLAAVAQLELGEDAADVGLHRLLRDDEALRDLGVGQALGDEPQHLGLPRGELAEALPAARRGSGRSRANSAISRRVTPGASSASPRRDHADGVEQLLGGDVLEQEAARARRAARRRRTRRGRTSSA